MRYRIFCYIVADRKAYWDGTLWTSYKPDAALYAYGAVKRVPLFFIGADRPPVLRLWKQIHIENTKGLLTKLEWSGKEIPHPGDDLMYWMRKDGTGPFSKPPEYP